MKSRRLILIILTLFVAGLVLVLPVAAAPLILFDGTVTLTKDATFPQVAYNSGTSYTVQEDTPLGALRAAATTADTYTDFTYDVTDKQGGGILLLDNVDGYLRKTPNYWNAYVNDVYKDGYVSSDQALNLMEIMDGDKVEFYYAPGTVDPNDLTAVKAAATAAVLTVANIPPPDYPIAKFSATPLFGLAPLTVQFTDASTGLAPLSYAWDFQNDGTVDSDQPSPSFTYNAIGTYTVNLTVSNSVSIDDEIKTDYINVIVMPTDWSLELSGARDEIVDKSYYESGLACAQSGHQVFWTEGENVWGGVPLWFLVGMVDDNPDVGPLHFNFNDTIAAEHYQVNVIGSDGTTATLDSARIARNDNIIVANTLNGDPLPLTTPTGKPSWPLHLKGSEVLIGEQIGDIARIELTGLPEPAEAWTLEMLGQVGDKIPKSEFENGLACTQSGHLKEWTQIINNTDGSVKETHVWSGVPLWVLLGSVDDIEASDHWTFSDDVAADGYTVKVWSNDGFYNKTFTAAQVARSSDYIVANMKDGQPLSGTEAPLRLVGAPLTRSTGALSGSSVSAITKIEILELQTPPAAEGSYNLTLKGKITDVLSQTEIEDGLACPQSGHLVEWTQVITNSTDGTTETHIWSGIPLWFLAGWVDDRQPHDFNTVQATAGYTIVVKSTDGFSKSFSSSDVAWSNDYIVATMKDGAPLTSSWPLQLVGDPLTKTEGPLSGLLGGLSVKKIAEIELTEFGVPVEAPTLHIVKYAEDRTTVVAEVTLDYNQMMSQFDIIGDGTTLYKYQGVTMDPTDIWGEFDETLGGYKISNAVKGTRLVDLVTLVGGMGVGTDLVTVASDGYKYALSYTSVYTTPEIQARQGDAILAWYADGEYVPGYADGMRLFFMPDDHIYGQWDMHESMPPEYWHYFYQTYDPLDPEYGQYAPGVLYPSAAGTSNKNVVELQVFTVPEKQWYINLDGTRVGGMFVNVSRVFFEQALACRFGANHEVSYTDSKGIYKGMPLWFLAGYVDDADQHSNNAYNRDLARQGYDIIVYGSGTYNKTFDSRLTVESNNYIAANTLNSNKFPETDTAYPLRLVGANATKGNSVGGIKKIVLNFRPVIDSLTVPTDPVKIGTDASVVAFFTDPYDTHTAVIDWGDGETSDGVVDEITHSVTGSHAYAMNGFYTVEVTLMDSIGVTAETTATRYIVVYDPNIGKASGDGTIRFAIGEYTLNPKAAGPAAFMLQGQYIKGVPKGNVKLVLQAAKSQFTAAFLDYIVIRDGTAYLHGMGSIDKSTPDYEFLLVVKDGGKKGSDTYRLQVWDLNMNKVFDNVPEAGDMLNPDTTPISSGSIGIELK